jgi:hypothetical protein
LRSAGSAHIGAERPASKSRIKAPYDVSDWSLSPTPSRLVILLGLELQEICGSDVLQFPCCYPKSTGHQAIGFSLRGRSRANTAFNRMPGSRSFLEKGGGTADKSFLD